jgi:hypothetical protein
MPEARVDVGRVACLRSCLMKPEHLEALPHLIAQLDGAAAAAMAQ